MCVCGGGGGGREGDRSGGGAGVMRGAGNTMLSNSVWLALTV